MSRLGSPLEPISEAMGAALHRDLPDVTYEDRDWEEYRKTKKDVRITRTRRPSVYDEIEVFVFPQTWGSTALGYGGMGGAAMTSAYTVVIAYRMRHFCVYFGGDRLAYKMDITTASKEGQANFMDDLHDHDMASCKDSTRYA